MRIITLLLVAALFGFNSAQAGTLNPGAKKAILEQDQTINDFSSLLVRQRVHMALSDMITTATKTLIEKGHGQLAAQIEREWEIVGAILLKNTEDLGDHRPLSEWLADTYTKMESALGTTVMQQLHLDDIRIVNFAVPVVAEPRGNWTKREYARHFVPLAGVATYWTSFVSCVDALGGRRVAYKYCDKVASVLRNGMSRDIAPMLSNFVFEKFNNRGLQRDFPIGYDELVRRYGPEISQIRN